MDKSGKVDGVVIGVGGYGLYRLGMNHGTQMTATVSTAATTPSSGGTQKTGDVDPTTGKKVLYWHDPMVPGQKFDKPGKYEYGCSYHPRMKGVVEVE